MAASTRLEQPKMPFQWVVGQQDLKLALRLAYIARRLGGVLISGQRGTGKSTAVRAFGRMVFPRKTSANQDERLQIVTLPINATEDRVVGGWRIDELMRGKNVKQKGLLEEAHERILYVDEVNLLDDHIVNIILDVTSTGVLAIQREGLAEETEVELILVGTMNPEEGTLRPQLLDRFGLMVHITAEPDRKLREEILTAVMMLERARKLARVGEPMPELLAAEEADRREFARLQEARKRFDDVKTEPGVEPAVAVASAFPMQGHRGDLVLLTAARAMAALLDEPAIRPEHIRAVARMGIQHRRQEAGQAMFAWRPVTRQPDGSTDYGDDGLVCKQLGLDPATPVLAVPEA